MPGKKFVCDRCKRNFRDNCNLQQHLEKKTLCKPPGVAIEEVEWICEPCQQSYSNKSNYTAHLKTKLHQRIARESAVRDATKETSEEGALSGNHGSPSVRSFRRVSIALTLLKSITGVQDLRQEQFYLGFAGMPEVWSDIKRSDGTPFVPRPDQLVLKFGRHGLNTARSITHSREYGVWQILDSVLTNNPTRVEREVKDDLKNRNELLSALHRNKTVRDTELVAVNGAEYKAIVERAIQMAARCETRLDMELEKELTRREEVKAEAEARKSEARKAEAESQARIAESKVRLLELQIRMKQLETLS